MNTTRRNLLSAAAVTGAATVLSQLTRPAIAAAANDPIDANRDLTSLRAKQLAPGEPGRDYTPVITPNGSTLPFRIVDGVKVMHLIAEEFEHEFMPGLRATVWGYNGSTPGPTIEAVEGERVRIYVTNKLPTTTSVHWHGIRVPSGMDGVVGISQPPIQPGETFRYEFVVPSAGTFMYHSHDDDMTQVGLGMMGLFIVHARNAPRVDRDFAIMLHEWRIDPGATRPSPLEMIEFNVLTMNGKVYPATAPLVAKLNDRVRLRFGNLGPMDHHPIHLHGFQMTQTETDGGILPESARYAMNTVLVPVGSTRAVDFVADNPGDWAMHCHMSHHTMNQMGHNVPSMVGVKGAALNRAIQPLVPGYMTMGQQGMGQMSEMQMDSPPNSVPMASGKGQFGDTKMGGMFTVVKVRENLASYDDPGDYRFPDGTRAIPATAEELKRDGIG